MERVMKSKTVLYVGGFELPDKNAAAQRVVANAKMLRDLGYNVIFVGIDKTLNDETLFEETKVDTADFTYFRIKYPISIKEWIRYLYDISFVHHFQPDLIIAYNYPALALNRLRKWCKCRNVKIVADCTEWYEPKGGMLFRLIKGLDVYFRMKIIQPELDGVIAISKYIYNYYSSRMRNVIQLPPLVDKQESKWKSMGNPGISNVVRLIYVGSPGTGNKDRLDIVINALEEIKKRHSLSFKFRIIGLTKDQYVKAYKLENVSSLSCDDCFEFMGRISHAEALNYLLNSDFQIFLRYNNLANTAGFPTKYVEATSCGVPVLTNTSSDMESYLTRLKNGSLLDISSQEKLIKSLLIPLQFSEEEKNALMAYCQNSKDIFDYRNYMSDMKEFMTLVEL